MLVSKCCKQNVHHVHTENSHYYECSHCRLCCDVIHSLEELVVPWKGNDLDEMHNMATYVYRNNISQLAKKQKQLPTIFLDILFDNLWELYET